MSTAEVTWLGPCPGCGIDVPWWSRQFCEPTPSCPRCPAPVVQEVHADANKEAP